MAGTGSFPSERQSQVLLLAMRPCLRASKAAVFGSAFCMAVLARDGKTQMCSKVLSVTLGMTTMDCSASACADQETV